MASSPRRASAVNRRGSVKQENSRTNEETRPETIMPLTDLRTLPPGVTEAAETLAGLDRCFLAGFSRLGAEQLAELQNLASLCAGTPLESPIAEAVASLGRNEFLDRHFVALAAAR